MKKQKENLFIILLGAAVLLVGMVGIYLSQLSPLPGQLTKPDSQTQKLESQGKTDEVLSIEQDLKATSLTTIDSELQDIEAELSGIENR